MPLSDAETAERRGGNVKIPTRKSDGGTIPGEEKFIRSIKAVLLMNIYSLS